MGYQETVDLGPLDSLAREAGSRPLRITPLEVLDYRPTSEDLTTHLAWPGTITILVSRKGSSVLERAREAVRSQNGNDGELKSELEKQSVGRKPVSLEEAAETVRAQGVFADLRYAGATVARSLFVPKEATYCAAVLPYNGGRLSASGFQLVEYYKEGAGDRLEAVAVSHAPPLTEAERAALEKVPENLLELNVGSVAGCYALCLVAVAVLVTLAAVCTYDLQFYQDQVAEVSPEDRIRDLGPEASARELVGLRRDMLRP